MTGTKTSVDESEGSEQLGSKSVPATIGDGVQTYVVGRSDWDRGAGERRHHRDHHPPHPLAELTGTSG